MNLAGENDFLGHQSDSLFSEKLLIIQVAVAESDRASVRLRLNPFVLETIAEPDDAKSGRIERGIDRAFDLRIGSVHVKASDPDLFRRRLRGDGRLVASLESRIEQIHSLDEVRNIFRQRADRVETFG